MTSTSGIHRVFGAVLLAIIVACSVFGVITATKAPVLLAQSGTPLTADEISRLRNVAGIDIPPQYFLRFPEFRAVAEEAQWWNVQRKVYAALVRHASVTAVLEDPDGQRHTQTLRVAYPDTYQAVKGSWLLYLAALLYSLIAWSVYSKHRTAAGTVLALFCLSAALYVATSAPIVSRGIALPFPQFRWLMDINYVADSGLIAAVYFALLFPERKPLLDRWPVLRVILIYFAVVNILYLGRFTGYDFSLPFLFFWSGVLILSLLHSLLREKDLFLRRQILVSTIVPAFVVVIFIAFNASPDTMGSSSVRFSTFVLVALLMPFALMSAMDNILLYRQRLTAEAQSHRERERIRQALHDDTLNKLANIALLSDSALHLLDKGAPQIRGKIEAIKRQATDYSQTIRQLLSVTDQSYGSWEDFSALLRSYGHDAAAGRDVAFELVFTRGGGEGAHGRPATAITVTLYHIFVEALANALQHANPRSIRARLHLDRDKVSLEITDDGDGFREVQMRPGHYGLNNMACRAQAMGGVSSVDSHFGQGTCIEVILPLTESLNERHVTE